MTDLLVEQVEFADVIVLNKMDLVTDEEASNVEAIIKALNPREARAGLHLQVPLDMVLDTGLFDYDVAANSAGWIRELAGEHTPETEEYGIGSFTYKQTRPFDADKLWAFFHDDAKLAERAPLKGFFWIAANPAVAYEWVQAGGVSDLKPMGMWWAAIPQEHWDFDEGNRLISVRTGTRASATGSSSSSSSGRAWTRPPSARDSTCLLDERVAAQDSTGMGRAQQPLPAARLRRPRACAVAPNVECRYRVAMFTEPRRCLSRWCASWRSPLRLYLRVRSRGRLLRRGRA